MSEPREVATKCVEVIPGLYHWRIRNSGIGGGISSSQALVVGETSVLVDPVQLEAAALAGLPRPAAIVLTARCHQRAAWRYRRQFGAEVWLPEDATTADEEPDRRYAEGDELPGGLRALRTPGPEWAHYCFVREPADEQPGVLFCSDLVMRYGSEATSDEAAELEFVPPAYHEDPAATRRSVEALLEQPFTVLCLAHGAPLLDEPKAALRRLLDQTR